MTGNKDYVAKSGTITFAPGETTKTITIEVKGDNKRESDEVFYVDLYDESGTSRFAKSRGTGTILNDDGSAAHGLRPAAAGGILLFMSEATRFLPAFERDNRGLSRSSRYASLREPVGAGVTVMMFMTLRCRRASLCRVEPSIGFASR